MWNELRGFWSHTFRQLIKNCQKGESFLEFHGISTFVPHFIAVCFRWCKQRWARIRAQWGWGFDQIGEAFRIQMMEGVFWDERALPVPSITGFRMFLFFLGGRHRGFSMDAMPVLFDLNWKGHGEWWWVLGKVLHDDYAISQPLFESFWIFFPPVLQWFNATEARKGHVLLISHVLSISAKVI